MSQHWLSLRSTVARILFVVATHAAVRADDNPCGISWEYSATSGKCYKFLKAKVDIKTAEVSCNNQSSFETRGTAKLAIISTKDDMDAIVAAAASNREDQWIGAKRQDGSFKWTDGKLLSDSKYWAPKEGKGECVALRIKDTYMDESWQTTHIFLPADCESQKGFFCEYKAKQCGVNTIMLAGYNPRSMKLVPNRTTVRTRGIVACKEGFYRDGELRSQNIPADANGLLPNHFYCTGSATSDRNPDQFSDKIYINSNRIEVCKAIECSIPNFNVSNVESQPIIRRNTPTGFSFNSSLKVKCTLGHVNYQDKANTRSAMMCKQSKRRPNTGLWVPGDLTPCIGVRCNQTQLLLMQPFRGKLVKAVNRKTQIQYDGSYQKSELNRYDNIVTVTCDDGYFFDDRSPSKTVLCGLKEGSKTQGEWLGYQGSKLPIPVRCERVTCRFQEVTPKETSNLKPVFMIRYANGTYEKRDTQSGEDYEFNAIIRFWCIEDYETANQNMDQNVTCGPQGQWIPKMTGCIQRTAKLDIGTRKHYEPAPQDAPAAKEVGAVVIVIMVLFLGLIVILDLSTVARDIKIMRHNIRRLRERW